MQVLLILIFFQLHIVRIYRIWQGTLRRPNAKHSVLCVLGGGTQRRAFAFVPEERNENINRIHNRRVTVTGLCLFATIASVILIILYLIYQIEASRGAAAQSVTVKPTNCGFDPHSRR